MKRRQAGERSYSIDARASRHEAGVVARAIVRAILHRAFSLTIDGITDSSVPIPVALREIAGSASNERRSKRWWRRLRPVDLSLMGIELDPMDERQVQIFLDFMLESIHAEVLTHDDGCHRAIFVSHDGGDAIYCYASGEELEMAASMAHDAGIDMWALVNIDSS